MGRKKKDYGDEIREEDFQKQTYRIYNDTFEQVKEETGFSIPEIARTVYFSMGLIADMLYENEDVEIKIDYIGKIRKKKESHAELKRHIYSQQQSIIADDSSSSEPDEIFEDDY